LTVLLMLAAVVPASAASRRLPRGRHIARVTVAADGRGSVIAVTYRNGARQRVRFLHTTEPVDHIALRDVDNDGQVDILATPHADDESLLFWRNEGEGQFRLATLPPGARPAPTRGPWVALAKRLDQGGLWGDERFDAALPRAPAVAAVVPVAFVRAASTDSLPFRVLRPQSDRAPPRS
jgi:FG-GAP-like repeat